jgi:hypothetical protein
MAHNGSGIGAVADYQHRSQIETMPLGLYLFFAGTAKVNETSKPVN